MDPATATTASAMSGLPRVSGDGPEDVRSYSTAGVAAPRERGWTLDVDVVHQLYRGCPA